MTDRIEGAITQAQCGSCGGAGGSTETTVSDGVTRQTWKTCGSCNGSGSR